MSIRFSHAELQRIDQAVAASFGPTSQVHTSDEWKHSERVPRYVAIYIMRIRNMAYTAIASFYGIHHTTAVYAFRSIEKQRIDNKELDGKICKLYAEMEVARERERPSYEKTLAVRVSELERLVSDLLGRIQHGGSYSAAK
jgi:hypothetical protein